MAEPTFQESENRCNGGKHEGEHRTKCQRHNEQQEMWSNSATETLEKREHLPEAMKYDLTGLEMNPRFGQLWISKQLNVNGIWVRESDRRVSEAEYENMNVMTSCTSDCKMFAYFNLSDTDTNWNQVYIKQCPDMLLWDRKHF